MRTLEAQVGALDEQQQFLEKLLADRQPPALPPSTRVVSGESAAT